jgi:hypothetical protein
MPSAVDPYVMATSGLTNENEDLFVFVGEIEGPLGSTKMFSTI